MTDSMRIERLCADCSERRLSTDGTERYESLRLPTACFLVLTSGPQHTSISSKEIVAAKSNRNSVFLAKATLQPETRTLFEATEAHYYL